MQCNYSVSSVCSNVANVKQNIGRGNASREHIIIYPHDTYCSSGKPFESPYDVCSVNKSANTDVEAHHGAPTL